MSPLIPPRLVPPVRGVNEYYLAAEQVPAAPVRAVLAFGSNLGERAATLAAAEAGLGDTPGIRVIAMSTAIDSVAVKLSGPDPDAPGYLNAVGLIETTLSPRALLQATAAIERRHGRERSERWGDRTLDIDIIAYAEERVRTPDLVIPHPRAAERDFVLAPWLEIDPAAVLPGAGPVAEVLARLREETP
ncbi:2-amino-4-hydroxy-6-hydroxymethyldihydropteridine diphosphokinase [Mycetocola spongiae]|uniref:2-amino-4-hydroxy-6- hydroxymethyldihydropteridine diphosphokinase n=1 Tax=Mycetocola spongiae TaxID=2859226 RepID=UPI001CF32B88|nr:2-amino-4-hydroxy-6-hydroxymethyldihydropteridine diphosphokinase [Mycetocola spongiae]UCR88505.1 2-amino-4-hydroxy-6-hydroxymethyldihydropteridine diphosphokinase [Mycetocola spongiae]